MPTGTRLRDFRNSQLQSFELERHKSTSTKENDITETLQIPRKAFHILLLDDLPNTIFEVKTATTA